METVWLTCPRCGQSFEVDVGFSGAVCRCLQCSALVSVPGNQESAQERPTRAQTPKGARFQPTLGPPQPMPDPEEADPEELLEATIVQPPVDDQAVATDHSTDADPTAEAYQEPADEPYFDPFAATETEQAPINESPQWGNPTDHPQASPADQWPQRDEQPAPTIPDPHPIIQEPSAAEDPESWPHPAEPRKGDQSKVGASRRPSKARPGSKPKARSRKKRKGPNVRAWIVGGFITIVVLMVVVVVVAVKYSITTTEPASAAEGEHAATGTDDPAAQEPSVGAAAAAGREAKILSVPTSAKTILVIDTGSSSGPWLPMVKGTIINELKLQPMQIAVQVVLTTEDGPMAFPDKPAASDDIDAAVCDRFVRGVVAMGDPDLIAAIQSAIDQQPTQILLVTGRDLTVEQIRQVSQSASDLPDLRFDVLAIGAKTSRLASFSRRHNGSYDQMTLDDVQKLFDDQP